MSYCRSGKNSHVYVYSTGEAINICVTNDAPKHALGVFSYKTLRDAFNRLESLKKEGLKIPNIALNRLKKEINAGFV